MSINSNIPSLFSETISSGSLNLLDKRKAILNKRVERTPDDITYLTSNTAWIRVTSGVDVIDEGGPEYAKKYQLFKGIASADGGFMPRGEGSERSSYTESTEYGFTPIAGITNFQLQSMNTEGTLKVGNITFVVNSPEDFNIIEKLYLRPGFNVLVEWGHSIRVNTDGTIDSNLDYFDTEKFLKPLDSEEIKKEIKRLRIANNFNYDGFYGKIRNFSWEYNGVNFLCNMETISEGDIINSLTNYDPAPQKDKSEISYSGASYSTDIVKILRAIKTSPVENFFVSNDFDNPNEEATENVKKVVKETIEKYDSAINSLRILVGNLASEGGSRDSNWTKYIRLRDFLNFINIGSLQYDKQGKNIFEFKTETVKEDGTVEETVFPFTTFPSHISVDPGVSILPKRGINSDFNIPFANQVTDLDENDILNIFISVDFILNKYNEYANAQKETDNSVYNIINSILKTLERDLGYINNFQIVYNEDENTYSIVDRTIVPSQLDYNTNGLIDLIGLKAEIENFQIISVINDDFANKISLAAQVSADPAIFENVSSLHAWSQGLKTRHQETATGGTNKTSPETQSKTIEELKGVYTKFLENRAYGNFYYLAYNKEDFEGYRAVHMRLVRKLLAEETSKRTTNYPGIIPISINLTLKGISGIKVLQHFRINDFFLPDNYKTRTGFKIMGLDEKISNGRWTTTINGYIHVL